MSTKLGDVHFVLKLDVSDANRDLNAIERRISTSGSRGMLSGKSLGGSGGSIVQEKYDKENYLKSFASQVIKKAGVGLMGSPSARAIQGLVGQVSDFVPLAARGPLTKVSRAALAYGIVSEGAKLIPEAFSVGRQIAGDDVTRPSYGESVNKIQGQLDELRRKFVHIENRVMSSITASSDASKFESAVMRLSGKKPNSDYYKWMFQHEREGMSNFNSEYQSIKSKQAPFEFFRTLRNLFR